MAQNNKESIVLIIVQRTLSFPFFLGIALVGALIMFIRWMINFVRFGGESIAYQKGIDRKTIQDVFVKLSEMDGFKNK